MLRAVFRCSPASHNTPISRHCGVIGRSSRGIRINPFLYGEARDPWSDGSDINAKYTLLMSSATQGVLPYEARVVTKKLFLGNVFDKAENVIVGFETVGHPKNIWSADLLLKLFDAIKPYAAQKNIQLLFYSLKENEFISSSDIRFLHSLTPEAANNYCELNHSFFKYLLEFFRHRSMAIVEGPCFDGGCDLALSCNRVLAANSGDVRFGFPASKIGLSSPGLGLYKSLSKGYHSTTLPVHMHGITLSAKDALKLFWISDMYDKDSWDLNIRDDVPKEIGTYLFRIITYLDSEREDVERADERRTTKNHITNLFLPYYEKNVSRNSYLFYLVTLFFIPFVIRTFWVTGVRKCRITSSHRNMVKNFLVFLKNSFNVDIKRKHALDADVKMFKKLFINPESANMRKTEICKIEQLRILSSIESPAQIKSVGMVGSGVFAREFVHHNLTKAREKWAFTVVGETQTNTRSYACLMNSMKEERDELSQYMYFHTLVNKREANNIPRSKRNEVDANRVAFANDLKALSSVDAVFLSSLDDLEDIKTTLRGIEQVVKPDCVIISASPHVPVSRLSEASSRPQNIVGMNFLFNPYSREFVELSKGRDTSSQAFSTALQICDLHSKAFVVSKDSPGFFTTRVLFAGLSEVLYLIEEGCRPFLIDVVLLNKGFGFRYSQMLDRIGIDKVGSILGSLDTELGFPYPQSLLNHLVKQNALGLECLNGIYSYSIQQNHYESVLKRPYSKEFKSFQRGFNFMSFDTIYSRVMLRMVNEALRCMEQGIVESPEMADVAAVYGVGFPGILSGPCAYVETKSPKHVLGALTDLARLTNSARFNPCDYLKERKNPLRASTAC